MEIKEKNNKKIYAIIGVVLVICAFVIVFISVNANSDKKRITEQLELGQKYFDELNYEQAIACFQNVIAIDPKNVDAYLQLADVYVAMGDYELAVSILESGYEETGAEELSSYTESIQTEMNQTREETEYFEDGSYFVKEYSAQGVLLKYSYYTADSVLSAYTMLEYSETGKLIKELQHSSDGSLIGYIVYEYSQNGQEVKDTHYTADGEIESYFVSEYDADGKEVKRTRYEADGTTVFFYTREYHDNGNDSKWNYYYGDGRPHYSVDLNEEGIQETVIYYFDDGRYSIDTYDVAGNRIGHVIYSADGTIADTE